MKIIYYILGGAAFILTLSGMFLLPPEQSYNWGVSTAQGIYPVTAYGWLRSGIIGFGVIMTAFSFMMAIDYSSDKQKPEICPTCGQEIKK